MTGDYKIASVRYFLNLKGVVVLKTKSIHVGHRIGKNPESSSSCRCDAYNQIVRMVKHYIEQLVAKYSTRPPEHLEMVLCDNQECWVVFLDNRGGLHEYWIALTPNGQLVDGTNKSGHPRFIDRFIKLDTINCDDAVAVSDFCYDKDCHLDYETMLGLHDELLVQMQY